jgi:hypothetical protein
MMIEGESKPADMSNENATRDPAILIWSEAAVQQSPTVTPAQP